MGISLLIRYRDPEKDKTETTYVPIAGARFFVNYWKPPADKLSLHLVWLFDTPGIPVSDFPEDIPFIVEQLNRLKDYAIMSKDIPEDKAKFMVQRIEMLAPALKHVQEHIDEIESASIG